MKAILFDLDGTIGNTVPLCIAAIRDATELLAARRLTDEEIIATFGPSEEGVMASLLPDQPAEGLNQYLLRYEQLHGQWPAPFDGMIEILSYLKAKQVLLGLVTGKGEQSTRVTLTNYGLDKYFDVIKTGAASGPIKDHRIEEVLEEFSLDREEILYVGDTPSDVKACRDCRVRIAAAAWAPTASIRELEEMRPDFMFTSVADFFAFLQRKLDSQGPEERGPR